MKNLLKIALISTLSTAALFAGNLSQKEISEIQGLPILLNAGVKVEKAYQEGDFIILRGDIRGNRQELVITADKKMLIAGKVYNAQTGEELAMPNDISLLKGKEALTYGTGKETLYLFTDPECPYCKKFESYFEQIKDKVTIKVFYFPLSFHENAVPMTKYILDNKTNEAKVKAMMNLGKDENAYKGKTYSEAKEKELQAIIDGNMKLAEEFGVRGTPALFDTEGKSVSWVAMLQKYGIQVK